MGYWHSKRHNRITSGAITRFPQPPPLESPCSSLTTTTSSSVVSCHRIVSSPAQDGGYAAWSFLIAAAVIEAVIWSIPFSFGILIVDYLGIPEIASQPNASTLVPLIGTLASGFIYFSGALVFPYISRHRTHIRPLIWLGMTLCWTSLLIASYSRRVYEYVIFQGVMYGIGGGLIYPACILYMSEWFSKRRGLANGIIFGGGAISGLIMPFILPPLVKAYGLFVTLRIISVAILVLLFPSVVFIRPRLPELSHNSHSTTVSSMRMCDRTWWILVTANVFQAFAFFIPLIYIPVFFSALHSDTTLSSLAVALLNGFSAAGPLLVGFLSDYFEPWPIAFILSILSLFSTVVFWGAIGDVTGVMLFGVMYGFVAGGWSTLWSSFVRRLSREDITLSMSMYGILMLTRGIGNVLSTPVSTALTPVKVMSAPSGSRQGFALDGGRFARLIAFIGACFAVATVVSILGWRWEKLAANRNRSVSV